MIHLASSTKVNWHGAAQPRRRDLVLSAGSRPLLGLYEDGRAYFFCGRCAAPVEEGHSFCPACRTGIGWVKEETVEFECGICGEALEEGWQYCPACTYPIAWQEG